MAFELLFLYSERKWRPPRKNRQKYLSFKSTAEGIILLDHTYSKIRMVLLDQLFLDKVFVRITFGIQIV